MISQFSKTVLTLELSSLLHLSLRRALLECASMLALAKPRALPLPFAGLMTANLVNRKKRMNFEEAEMRLLENARSDSLRSFFFKFFFFSPKFNLIQISLPEFVCDDSIRSPMATVRSLSC